MTDDETILLDELFEDPSGRNSSGMMETVRCPQCDTVNSDENVLCYACQTVLL